MLINDRVYGGVVVNEPSLVELINSQPIQRLKGIAQFGLPDKYYQIKGFSRFEHSVGVMLLLRRFGATTEEQIAGLLHDVSHSAFSHTIDWVMGDETKEDIQDSLYSKFIKGKEITKILKKHGYDPERISNLENFHLLESAAPNLCGDRIDYLLREPGVPTSKLILGIIVVNDKFLAKNIVSARLLANTYLERQLNHWGGYQAAYRWKLLAICLKYALKKKIITKSDFFKDDAYLVTKLKISGDKKIMKIFNTLRKKSTKSFPRLGLVVHKKIRYIDPEFIDKNGQIKRLSQLDKRFNKKLKSALKTMSEGVRV